MKTIAFGVSALLIVTLSFVALLQVVNVDTRAVSLQDTLHGAMEASLSTAMSTRGYTIDDEDELVADVVQGIILELGDPRAELEVRVNEADRFLGIISMKVTARYPSVTTGEAGEGTVVSVERTVVLEHVNNAPAPGSHAVRFVTADGATVKAYMLASNSQELPYPSFSPGSRGDFLGWELGTNFYPDDAAGHQALKALPLDKDYTFVARTTN